VNADHARQHLTGLIVEKRMVQTTTLNEIVKEYKIKEIDILHTETEGHDYRILMNYNYEIKPKKIMYEHKHMDGYNTVGNKYV
jgi:hypothetical protein